MRDSQITSKEGRALASLIADLQAEVRTLKAGRTHTQLPNSSLEGSLRVHGLQGQLMKLGQQTDGTAGVIYRSGPKPPMPANPTVSARQLSVVVGWDGTFAGGAAKPGNFARIDVHTSETSGYIPDGTTIIGSLFAESALSYFGDNDLKYVRLVAVSTSDVMSDPTPQIAVLPLPVDQIAAGAIATNELAANIVLVDTQITAGTPGGKRVEINGDGMEAFNAQNVKVFDQDTSTGNIIITGEYLTAATGQRVAINPGNTSKDTIRFYPSSGTQFAEITGGTVSNQAAIQMYSNTVRSDGQRAEFTARPDVAGMTWGKVIGGPIRSRVEANIDHVMVYSPTVDISADHRSSVDVLGYRISHYHTGTDGSTLNDSVIEHRTKAGNEAWLVCPVRNVGIVFGVSQLYVSNNQAGGGTVGITAAGFNVASGRDAKQDIRDLQFDALAAVRKAKVKLWKYRGEGTRRPAGEMWVPGRKHPDGSQDPPMRMPEYPWEQRPAPDHFFPLAEDMPEALVHYPVDRPDEPHVDLRDWVGVVTAAVDKLAARVELLEQTRTRPADERTP